MTSSKSVQDRLQLAFAPTSGGIVCLTEQLLTACGGSEVEFERVQDRCVCRWIEGGEAQEWTIPLSPAAFRTLLARIAVLCNERTPGSVTPYGGEGSLAPKSDPSIILQVVFVNTPNHQQLKLKSSDVHLFNFSKN